MAEHFFAKVASRHPTERNAVLEKTVDLFFEIGKVSLGRKQNDLAVQWLARAYEAMIEGPATASGPETNELRMSILHTYGAFETAGYPRLIRH